MNQPVSLDNEFFQLLLLQIEVIGIRIHAEPNGQRCFCEGFCSRDVGRFSIEVLMQFADQGAHGFHANAFGLFLVLGRDLIDRGLEITKQEKEFQLDFEALKMEDIASPSRRVPALAVA